MRDFPRASNSYGLSFNQKREAHSNQFVHWTGSVFVRIVDQPIELKLQTSPSVRKINFEDKTEDELETYKDSSKRLHLKVDTLLSDLGTDLNEEKFPTGFFWTPNYSLTKKSRSSYTGRSLGVKTKMSGGGSTSLLGHMGMCPPRISVMTKTKNFGGVYETHSQNIDVVSDQGLRQKQQDIANYPKPGHS